MISGIITNKNPTFSINSSLQIPSPTKPPSFHSFPLSPTPYLQSQLHSPRSRTFTRKATISNEFVISETDTNMSFYDLLGISESGSFVEIKQAYKQLARKFHPDVSPPERTEEYTKRFIRVQEAYQTLSDPNTKALYDRDMARGLHLAFSARKYDEGLTERRNEWKNQWQSQVADLKMKGKKKNSNNNMSWAAQMRQKRFESEGTN